VAPSAEPANKADPFGSIAFITKAQRSAAVGWEIVIKRSLGKLVYDGNIAATIEEEGFGLLPIELTDVEAVAHLPDVHRDPFDRLLIAQARVRGLTLVTADPNFHRYRDVQLLKV